MAKPAQDPGFSLASWQQMVRGFVITGFSYLLMAYAWPQLTGPAIAAAGGMGLAGICGIGAAWQSRRVERWLDHFANGGLDLLFASGLLVIALWQPQWTVTGFAVWTLFVGGLAGLRALPSRSWDDGPRWAWLWTGISCASLGVLTLIFSGMADAKTALWVGAAGLLTGTMIILLGMDLTEPEVLTMPDQESAAETHFSYNEITYRPTPEEPRDAA